MMRTDGSVPPAMPAEVPSPRRELPAEAAILAATERLLDQRPFSELAVSDILRAAGVSRTSFYAHFTSRTAVLVACLRRVAGELAAAVAPSGARSAPAAAADPADAIRGSLRRWSALAATHGGLLRTVSEEWPHDPELGALWLEVMSGFAAGMTDLIVRARAAGEAPPGPDAEALATCLMWGCEQVLHVALVGGALGLDDPEAIVEPLAQMVLGTVYGTA